MKSSREIREVGIMTLMSSIPRPDNRKSVKKNRTSSDWVVQNTNKTRCPHT